MVNNHRHSYGESIKKPPWALLLNSIQTTNYALNVRFRSIGPQPPILADGINLWLTKMAESCPGVTKSSLEAI